MAREGLTGKQRVFVEAYLGEAQFNATEAARVAGLKQPHSQGPRLLENVGVKNAIEARLKEAQMSADEVLSELADIARSDWRDHLVIKRDREGNEIEANLRLADKIKALELVGKYHKLFADRTELTGKDGGPIRVAKAEDLTDDELAAIANK